MRKQRIPKIFRTPITADTLEKKILRRIFADSEKKFLTSCLRKDKQGRFLLRPELTKEELKRLKKLSISIKKNRGLLVSWKAGILAAVLIITAGFNYFLKNSLLEHAAERALQTVFRAAADMEGTELSLLKGRIGFSHLTIADEDQPMFNLIELGKTNLFFDTPRLLSRRIVLDEIACREIRFHTPRTESGALPHIADSEKQEGSGSEADGAISGVKNMGLEIGRESAERLLRDYRDSLQAPELIESIQDRSVSIQTRWNERTDQTETEIEDLDTRTRELMEEDISSIDTVQEIDAYLKKVDTLRTAIRDTRQSFNKTYDEYQDDSRYLRDSRESVESAVEEDLRFLKTAAGTFGSDAAGVISAAARPVLRDHLGSLYTYGERIIRIYKRLSGASEEKEGRFTGKRRAGTNVTFPYREYPAFLIKSFEASAGSQGTGNFSIVRINDLTGDQETWGKPSTAFFSTNQPFSQPNPEPNSELSSDLMIDTRSTSRDMMNSKTRLSGLPVEISEGLDILSVRSLRADSDNIFELNLQPDLSGTGKADINLSNILIDYSDTESVIGGALSGILSDVETLKINAAFTFENGTLQDLDLTSTIDGLLNERIGEYTREQAEKSAREIETAFYDYIGEELETNDALSEEISLQGKELLENIRAAENLEKALDERREALREKAEKEVEQQTQDLKEKAKEGLENIGKDLKLPGF